jgi:hypothetical protein
MGFGQDTFSFIENIERLSSPAGVMNIMQRLLARFGGEQFCFNGHPRLDQPFEDVLLAADCRPSG